MKLTARQIKNFRRKVDAAYKKQRRVFPWRQTKDPYHILVSEIMLQQTQADRVVSKYLEFVKKFPTAKSLAVSPLADVLRVWQGLGYNRRAKMLQNAARLIVEAYQGQVPDSIEALQKLPGVGPYTARAVMAFAYDRPSVFIETNIRTVFIHEFFRHQKKVADSQLLPLIAQTLKANRPGEWYLALMDYGAVLKRLYKNPSRRSTQYVRQSKFNGSTRQIRGAIIRELSAHHRLTARQLFSSLSFDTLRVQAALADLVAEGLIRRQKKVYFL